jgi:hypothetical protein
VLRKTPKPSNISLLSAPVARRARSAPREFRAVRILLPGPVTMPDHIKSGELSECEERERLRREIRDAIRQTIRMRDVPDAELALKAW